MQQLNQTTHRPTAGFLSGPCCAVCRLTTPSTTHLQNTSRSAWVAVRLAWQSGSLQGQFNSVALASHRRPHLHLHCTPSMPEQLLLEFGATTLSKRCRIFAGGRMRVDRQLSHCCLCICSCFLLLCVQLELLRRARVWDDLDWKYIELGQKWKAGEVRTGAA